MSERWDRRLNAFSGYCDPVTAIAVSTIGAAVIGSNAADKASATSAAGTSASLAQNEKFFDIGREDLAPYRELGGEAVDQIRNVFLNGDMDEFYESADYQFNLQQSEEAIQRKQSSEGSRFGGAALKEAVQFASGTASNEFNNFFNRLNSVASIGANAAAGSAGNASQAGANASNTIQTGANNQANIGIQGAQSMNQAIQGGISNLTTLNTYNDLTKLNQPNYSSGSVTSKPSIFNS